MTSVRSVFRANYSVNWKAQQEFSVTQTTREQQTPKMRGPWQSMDDGDMRRNATIQDDALQLRAFDCVTFPVLCPSNFSLPNLPDRPYDFEIEIC